MHKGMYKSFLLFYTKKFVFKLEFVSQGGKRAECKVKMITSPLKLVIVSMEKVE
jgi:hypothetical protein